MFQSTLSLSLSIIFKLLLPASSIRNCLELSFWNSIISSKTSFCICLLWKTYKIWHLGINWCSNCCNLFIIFLIFDIYDFWYVWHCRFFLLLICYHRIAFHINANDSGDHPCNTYAGKELRWVYIYVYVHDMTTQNTFD